MSDERSIDPERARARFRRAQLVIAIIMMLAFVAQIGSNPLKVWLRKEGFPELGLAIRLAATAILVVTGCFYARLKGRSAAWGLVGAIGCIGYFILLGLEKHCLRCGTRAKSSADECPSCRAPI